MCQIKGSFNGEWMSSRITTTAVETSLTYQSLTVDIQKNRIRVKLKGLQTEDLWFTILTTSAVETISRCRFKGSNVVKVKNLACELTKIVLIRSTNYAPWNIKLVYDYGDLGWAKNWLIFLKNLDLESLRLEASDRAKGVLGRFIFIAWFMHTSKLQLTCSRCSFGKKNIERFHFN